jgi:hypothetical protein
MTSQVIDLFCGLGGFSRAFEEDDSYEVTSVDIDEGFNPDIVADVLNLTWEDLPDADIILASPPCNAFTILRSGECWREDQDGCMHPTDDFARTSIQLVHHTVGLIHSIDPDWWVMENPRGIMRRVYSEPDYHVWFCQYGRSYAKPTDLWGTLPESFEAKTCKPQNPRCDHTRAASGSVTGIQGGLPSEQRAKVPYGLSEAIKQSIENPKPTQQTLI